MTVYLQRYRQQIDEYYQLLESPQSLEREALRVALVERMDLNWKGMTKSEQQKAVQYQEEHYLKLIDSKESHT